MYPRIITTMAFCLLLTQQVQAEQYNDTPRYSQSALDTLVAPIALYVDDLAAIVLAASVYPLQVVQAERFLADRDQDESLAPDPDWEDPVVAMLNYPQVLQMMSEEIDWTADLGEAFYNQPEDVLDAIQRFRQQVRDVGNLTSDEHVVVQEDGENVRLVSVDPEVIYVPYYEPANVIVYQRTPVIRYYSARYPLYYYPYRSGYSFETRWFFGVTTAYSLGWNSRNLHIYYRDYDRHPYYGRRYVESYYTRHPRYSRRTSRIHDDVWRPSQPRRFSHRDRQVTRSAPARTYSQQPSHRPQQSVTSNRNTYTGVQRDFNNRRQADSRNGRREDHGDRNRQNRSSGYTGNHRTAPMHRPANPARDTARDAVDRHRTRPLHSDGADRHNGANRTQRPQRDTTPGSFANAQPTETTQGPAHVRGPGDTGHKGKGRRDTGDNPASKEPRAKGRIDAKNPGVLP